MGQPRNKEKPIRWTRRLVSPQISRKQRVYLITTNVSKDLQQLQSSEEMKVRVATMYVCGESATMLELFFNEDRFTQIHLKMCVEVWFTPRTSSHMNIL